MKLSHLLLGLMACTPSIPPAPQPIDSVTVVSDAFDAPAGTNLIQHLTLTGQHWITPSGADPLIINESGRVSAAAITAAGALYFIDAWTPSGPDYTISADITIGVQEDGAEAGLLGGRGGGIDNGVGLGVEVFENTYRVVLGTSGRSVASTAATLEPGTYKMSLRFAGDTAFGVVDGVELKLGLGAELATGGPVGLFGFLEAPPINGGLQFDNYTVSVP